VWWRSKQRKSQKYDERIAIMINSAAACLDITASKNQQIIASQSIPIPEKKDMTSMVAEVVDTFCKQHKLEYPACTLMLPASSYQMLLVEAPPVKKEELAEALQWKVKDLLHKAMEESVIDGFLLPDDAYRGRQKMAYTVVADRAELQAVANSLETINVELDRIEIPELALLRLLENYPRESQTEMIVVIGRQSGFLTVVADQALYLSRVINISDQALQAMPLSNSREIESFILEMQRSRDYFESQIGKGTIGHILLAPLENNASALSHEIHQRLDASIEIMKHSVITDFTLASEGAEALLLASAAKAA
jgi:MSHA biogenesis protein MshI